MKRFLLFTFVLLFITGCAAGDAAKQYTVRPAAAGRKPPLPEHRFQRTRITRPLMPQTANHLRHFGYPLSIYFFRQP